ncbi:MAG: MotA/TolQ/ExbB proton channel family protein [Pseudomonadota bacterium]|nr:MotA/TolQ/ExbB proton channel family protein [Pseudomonadota bacterium]
MNFVSFIQNGGFFMYPILLIGALGIAIIVERYLFLSRVKKQNQALWKKVQPLLMHGDTDAALLQAREDNSEVGRVLDYGLTTANSGADMQHVESALEEGLLESIPRLEARTSYVATFANIATLLGLLGTVQGLIAAFESVANADPALKGDLLSAAISVAMNTTAFGLAVAIPLLLAYTFLQNYTQHVIESIEMISMKVQNQIRQLRRQV